MTFVTNLIDEATKSVANGSIKGNEISMYMSDALNKEWNPAWNVVVYKLLDSTNDAIVFGYAFNKHWLWFNNYLSSNISYIIWKDYNCFSWVSIGASTASPLKASVVTSA